MSLTREDIESLAKRMSALSVFDSQSSGDAMSLYDKVCAEENGDSYSFPFGAILKKEYQDTTVVGIAHVLEEKFNDYMTFANYSGLSSSVKVTRGSPLKKTTPLKTAIQSHLYNKKIYDGKDVFLTDASVSDIATHVADQMGIQPADDLSNKGVSEDDHEEFMGELYDLIAESVYLATPIPKEFRDIANEMGVRQCGSHKWDHEIYFLTAIGDMDNVTAKNIRTLVEKSVQLYGVKNIKPCDKYVGSEAIKSVISDALDVMISEQKVRKDIMGRIPRGFNLEYVRDDYQKGCLRANLHYTLGSNTFVDKGLLNLDTGRVNHFCSEIAQIKSIEISSNTEGGGSVFIPLIIGGGASFLDLPSVSERMKLLNELNEPEEYTGNELDMG